jgi:uncharacterized Zn finger protein (UPF0148 family)
MVLYEWNPKTRIFVKRCTSCDKEYDKEYVFCPVCGEKLVETYAIVIGSDDTIQTILKSLMFYNDDIIRRNEFSINMRWFSTSQNTNIITNVSQLQKEIDICKKENEMIDEMLKLVKENR